MSTYQGVVGPGYISLVPRWRLHRQALVVSPNICPQLPSPERISGDVCLHTRRPSIMIVYCWNLAEAKKLTLFDLSSCLIVVLLRKTAFPDKSLEELLRLQSSVCFSHQES